MNRFTRASIRRTRPGPRHRRPRDVIISLEFHKNLLAAFNPGAKLLFTDRSIMGGGEGTKIEVQERI